VFTVTAQLTLMNFMKDLDGLLRKYGEICCHLLVFNRLQRDVVNSVPNEALAYVLNRVVHVEYMKCPTFHN